MSQPRQRRSVRPAEEEVAPPTGGYKPEREYVLEGEWMRGDPSSLGLICFGMTTAMLMFIETTWTGDGDTTLKPTVIFYALAFGGIGQLIAGILDMIKGNTFGGTVFSSYGCFWIGWGLLEFSLGRYPENFVGATKTGQTLFFGLWALLTLIFFIASLRRTASIQTVLFTLTITFILLAGGVWDTSCKEGAGYMGAFCAGSALYAAFIIMVKMELGYSLPGIKPNLLVKHPLDNVAAELDRDSAQTLKGEEAGVGVMKEAGYGYGEA